MKNIIIMLVVISSLNCYSQRKVYNTIIEKATKVEIIGGKAEIKNVENLTIASITIQNIRPKYGFAELDRQKDSSGFYTTKITLRHSGDPENIFVNYMLEFDKPVNSVVTAFTGVATSVNESFANDKTWYIYKGFVQTTEKVITVIIKSNSLVFIKISGIDAIRN